MKVDGQIIFTEYTVVAKGQHFMTVVFSPHGKARVPIAKIFRNDSGDLIVRDFKDLVIGKGTDLDNIKKQFVELANDYYEKYKPAHD